MTEEERVIIKLAADNKALRDLVDWQAAENKQLHDQIKAGIAQRYWDDKQPYTVGECKAYEIGFTDGEVFGGMEARDECRDEIRRLREALRVIADGDTPREHAIIYRSDGVHSKHDKCKHGAWMYDGCEDCVTEYASAALGEGK